MDYEIEPDPMKNMSEEDAKVFMEFMKKSKGKPIKTHYMDKAIYNEDGSITIPHVHISIHTRKNTREKNE